METIKPVFDRFFTKCKFISGNQTTEWYKMYYTVSNQNGFTLLVGHIILDGKLIPLRFMPYHDENLDKQMSNN